MKPIRTEGQLSFHIVSLAERLGWRVFTIRDSRAAKIASRTGPGFPDLLMVRWGRLLAYELKLWRKKSTLTAEQAAWLDAFASIPNAQAGIWTERDWEDGTIAGVLRVRNPSTPHVSPWGEVLHSQEDES